MAGTCECGNETSGAIKYREILDQLRICGVSLVVSYQGVYVEESGNNLPQKDQ